MTSNVPEPKTTADRVLMKAAELLDQDEWDSLTERFLTVRGVKIKIESGARFVWIYIGKEGDPAQLCNATPSYEIADLFWDSYQRFLYRRREDRLSPIEKQITTPPVPKPAPGTVVYVDPPKRRRWW